jgi:hypothetical protein
VTSASTLSPRSDTDTRPQWDGPAPVRRARLARRVLLVLFSAFLLLGAAGVLGVRSGTVTGSGGGYELRVDYAKVTRAGQSVPFKVRVTKDGGFGEDPIRLRITADYFDLFDENSVDPDASASTSDDRYTYLEFDPPDGDVFVMRTDTRTGPNRQRGKSASVSVLVDDEPVVTVDVRTRVMP